MLKLRDYQVEGVTYLTRAYGWRLLVIMTGGGKTDCLKAAVAQIRSDGHLNGVPFKGAVLVTTQTHIEAEFGTTNTYTYPGLAAPLVFDNPLCPRDDDEALLSLLAGTGQVVVTTHNILRDWFKNDRFRGIDMTGFLLVIDEVHHNGKGETWLYSAAEGWAKQGGAVWGATATGFRTDELPINLDQTPTFVRSYADLAVSHPTLFPQRITFNLLELGHEVLPGFVPPSDRERILRHVVASGRLTLLQLRPGGEQGDSGKEAELFIQTAIRDVPGLGMERDRIFNVVLDAPKADAPMFLERLDPDIRKAVERYRKNPLAQVLKGEKATVARKGHEGRLIDMIVSCGRFREGADWPGCSQVMMVGSVTTLLLAIQILGRGLRPKGDISGYPASHKDETVFTIVVPQLARRDGSYTNKEHAQALLLLACYLAAEDATSDFGPFWRDLVRGFRLPPSIRDPDNVKDVAESLGIVDTPQAKAEAYRSLLEVIYGVLASAPPAMKKVTLDTVVSRLVLIGGPRMWPILRAAIESVSAGNPALREAVREVLRQVAKEVEAELIRAPSTTPGHLRHLFLERLQGLFLDLAQGYGHLVVDYHDKVLTGFQGTLMAGAIRGMVEELRHAREKAKELTWPEIDAVARGYMAQHGMPAKGSPQDLTDFVGYNYTLQGLQSDLRERFGLDLSAVFQASKLGWVTGITHQGEILGRLLDEHLRVLSHPKFRPSISRLDPKFGLQHWTNSTRILATVMDRKDQTPVGSLIGTHLACLFGWRGRKPMPRGLLDALAVLARGDISPEMSPSPPSK